MMRDCQDAAMRDLLPDFVHETLSAGERARVAEHVASCADCAAEVSLIQSARKAFSAGTPAVDVARIVAALPVAPSVTPRRAVPSVAWRIAAAFGLVALGGLSVVVVRKAFVQAPVVATVPPVRAPDESRPGPDAPAAQQVPVAPQAREIAAAPHEEGLSFGGGLSDLTDEQLKTLLRAIDDIQATPNVEPEVQATPIIPPREGGSNAK
jgi:anti-sigma factor RsiW